MYRVYAPLQHVFHNLCQDIAMSLLHLTTLGYLPLVEALQILQSHAHLLPLHSSEVREGSGIGSDGLMLPRNEQALAILLRFLHASELIFATLYQLR
jgi:hypothetical protein